LRLSRTPAVLDLAFDRAVFPNGTTEPIDGSLVSLQSEYVMVGDDGTYEAQNTGKTFTKMVFAGYGSSEGMLVGVNDSRPLDSSALTDAMPDIQPQIPEDQGQMTEIILPAGTSIGIRINTYANSRTAFASLRGSPHAVYAIPLKSGMSIGMLLISVELLLMLMILLFVPGDYAGPCFIGFAIGESLGASALRIAGGIFTKIADIGSDLMKIVFNVKEDDARNPGVIADCTGDNAGDSVGPSADGFETYGVTGVALISFILLAVHEPSTQVRLFDEALRSHGFDVVLCRDPGSTPLGEPAEGAQRAITHLRPMEQLTNYTIIECRLETGRTHQIRIHLSEIGRWSDRTTSHRAGASLASTTPSNLSSKIDPPPGG